MNRNIDEEGAALIDVVAQSIQRLRSDRRQHNGRKERERPLLRIDNLTDAARAPFQFDAAGGRLHRRGCRSISTRSRHALYGLWRIDPEECKLACPSCKPVPMEEKSRERGDATDILFGLVSLVDQFGSVLRERGREYRNSEDGHELGRRFEGLFQRLDQREQDFLSTLLNSMDGLITAVRDIDDRLNKSNREDKSNGHEKDEPADET